jgi:hypothetical protein
MITFYRPSGHTGVTLVVENRSEMRTDESERPKQKPVSAAPRRTRRAGAAASRAKRTAPPALPTAMPGEEQIRLRAYHFYLERAGLPGDPVADWIRAERDLIAETAKTRVNP